MNDFKYQAIEELKYFIKLIKNNEIEISNRINFLESFDYFSKLIQDQFFIENKYLNEQKLKIEFSEHVKLTLSELKELSDIISKLIPKVAKDFYFNWKHDVFTNNTKYEILFNFSLRLITVLKVSLHIEPELKIHTKKRRNKNEKNIKRIR